jgi:predicted PurR-regulated permease PerM
MDFLFVMIILSAVLGAVGYAAWFIFFVWLAKKAYSATQRDLDRMLPNLEQLIRTYSNLPPAQQQQQQMQIMNMMMQANSQMRQLQDIQRQRYDLRIGELQGMAANAGVDWTPPSY